MSKVWFFIYNCLIHGILPLFLIKSLLRNYNDPIYKKGIAQRYGFDCIAQASRPGILLHAVSVGESIAAESLIRGLLKKFPNYDCYVTSTTLTGYTTIQRLFSREIDNKQLKQRYLPYDFIWSAPRLLKALSIKQVIIIETEIWPNLYGACDRQSIPIMLANARLSDRSAQGYRKILPLIRRTLRCVQCIACRDKIDYQHFLSIGAEPHQLYVTGNIKFDIKVDQDKKAQAQQFKVAWKNKKTIIVAASTHEGEDELILSVFQRLYRDHPQTVLVLVPRHPERFDRVYQQCVDTQLLVIRRSEQRSALGENKLLKESIHQTLLLADTMGEMLVWLSMADIVIMGGSFVKVGGHNPLEAAITDNAIITGPHIDNFMDIYPDLIEQEGAIQVNNEALLYEQLNRWLDGQCGMLSRLEVAKQAKQFVMNKQGVTESLLQLIQSL